MPPSGQCRTIRVAIVVATVAASAAGMSERVRPDATRHRERPGIVPFTPRRPR